MIPCSCAASSALAICLGDRECLVHWDRPLRDAVLKGRPLNQFHDEGPALVGLFQAIDGGDVRVVQSGEDLGFAPEAGNPIGIAGE